MRNDRMINNLNELDFRPECFASDVYETLDWTNIDSEMTDGQRRFISGLVSYYKPENVLELGVSAGGGTVVLLNALLSNKSWKGKLLSIDKLKCFYRDPNLPVGHLARRKFPDLFGSKWILEDGKDPAEVFSGGGRCTLGGYEV
ncbi:hypothetical protein [Selenomonas ruminantium]|uniref:Methyltransferase n=1 Tax=Selenomonas ruminantium TaxID=971 RepID=A0A1H3ZJD9_SELRU|nr:hypothetical protein [Selenomonas ruminantium]SEA23531.1 hypothetical protein SAMN05660648_02451 [Selenomonas ruminantium]